MSQLTITVYGECDAATLQAFERSLKHVATLSDVLVWARESSWRAAIQEAVAQDEFTHDIVFENLGNRYAVFDVT